MIVFSKFAAASAALVVTLAASTASAAIVTATYSGKVRGTNVFGEPGGAFDNVGVFGTLTNLEGVDFAAAFTFDTSRGERTISSNQDQLVGSAALGLGSPYLSAILTIEGVDHAFQSDALAFALVVTDGVDVSTLHLVSNGFSFLSAGLQNPELPLDLAGPFSGLYIANSPDNPVLGEFQVGEGEVVSAHGYLAASHLTISSAAVPEPATWGLMLIGFGGLGLMARRARRAGLPPPA